MGLTSLLFKDPIMFFILAIPLLYSIIAHELAHGWAAYLFGDDTAKRLGRLSLNPIVHLDPIGTIALFFVGFGWARPVPVNYYNFRNFRLGLIIVSLAGCLTNIFIATVAIFLLQFLKINPNSYISSMLLVLARVNVILGAFNLIPLPPLDGSKIIMGFLPDEARMSIERYEHYGFIILFFLLLTGFVNPLIIVMQKVILSFIGMLLGFTA